MHPLGPANVSRPFATSSKILRRSRNSVDRDREREKKGLLDCVIFGSERERERKTQKRRSEGRATKSPSFPLSQCLCFWVSLRFLSDSFVFLGAGARDPFPPLKWVARARRRRLPEPAALPRRGHAWCVRVREDRAIMGRGGTEKVSRRRRVRGRRVSGARGA